MEPKIVRVDEVLTKISDYLIENYLVDLEQNNVEKVIESIVTSVAPHNYFIDNILDCAHTTYCYYGIIVETLVYYFKQICDYDVKLINLRDYLFIPESRISLVFNKDLILNEANLEGFEAIHGGEGAGEFAYWGIRGIELSQNITYIGDKAFKECSELKNVKLSDGIKRIENDAFWGCRSLNTITLPKSLEYIANDVFNLTGVTEISYLGTIDEFWAMRKAKYWDRIIADEFIRTIKCSDGKIPQ